MENIKKFIGFALGVFLIFASWVAVELALLVRDSRKLVNDNTLAITATVNNLKAASDKAPTIANDLALAVVKGKDFADTALTKDRARSLDNYFDVLEINAHLGTTGLQEAIKESVKTSQDLRAKMNPLADEVRELVKEGKLTVIETRHQIKQNGDEIHALLVEGKTLVRDSKEKLIATLDEVNKAANGVQILVNEPELKEIIHSSNLTLQNIQVITKETADLSTYLIEPIVRPRKATGLARFGQIVLKVIRVVNGSGQILFLIDRLGG